MDNIRPTWAEIDLNAIKHNLASVRKVVAPAMIMAVVKADGYGHGMLEVSQTCLQEGVECLGVASLDEALFLRESGIRAPILVLGYIPEEFAELTIKNDIRASVFTFAFAEALSKAAVKLSQKANLHIKIDTGMGRLGFSPMLENINIITQINELPGIRVEGIFTHFAESDSLKKDFSHEQLAIFSNIILALEQLGMSIPWKHCSNSAALMDIPESHFNMVRAGIVLYGLYPSPFVKQEKLPIIPAMTLKSRISFLKELEEGHSVSYDRTYYCSRRTKVATVPIGYGDGYSRLLSNRGYAVIRGQAVPLIGNVCMDQCMFDVSKLDEVKEGDEVILFGRPENGITADDLARIIGTINYEVICSHSARVPRIYIEVTT
ncbi:MAG: alanine racemase [Syntrophomonadaceae bacterium]|nr:alanine racemase [Syntrophomonadaceae bacterium]MDD3022623.1 alanine racemase [Syntrophomonadaceae bacterium]